MWALWSTEELEVNEPNQLHTLARVYLARKDTPTPRSCNVAGNESRKYALSSLCALRWSVGGRKASPVAVRGGSNISTRGKHAPVFPEFRTV